MRNRTTSGQTSRSPASQIVPDREAPVVQRLAPYLELTKPRLTALAVLTAGMGFLLGTNSPFLFEKFLMMLLGTTCVGAGAAVLNQLLEKEADSKMNRTKRRPIPSGRVSLESALTLGVILSVAGLLILSLGTNLLAGSLAVLTLTSYLFLYTPLKSRSALCTLVGAIPGALPPMIGWAAATGTLGKEAWLLFAILFLWQLPHFLALAWKFRDDYARAGFKMLPVLDPDGGLTFRQITLYCLALVPVTLLPAVWGWAGGFYFLTALVSSLAFLGVGLKAAYARSGTAAHQFFLASILYLPFLLITLLIDRMVL